MIDITQAVSSSCQLPIMDKPVLASFHLRRGVAFKGMLSLCAFTLCLKTVLVYNADYKIVLILLIQLSIDFHVPGVAW